MFSNLFSRIFQNLKTVDSSIIMLNLVAKIDNAEYYRALNKMGV